MTTTPTITIVAEQQLLTDGDPQRIMTEVLTDAQKAGLITRFEITHVYPGVWGLQLVTFTVAREIDGNRFKAEHDAEQAKAAAKALLDFIIGDTDVDVRWIVPAQDAQEAREVTEPEDLRL